MNSITKLNGTSSPFLVDPVFPPDPAPLTEQMQQVLSNMQAAKRPAFHTLDPDSARALYAKAADILEPPAPSVESEETYRVSTVDAHSILLKLWRPKRVAGASAPGNYSPALVYFHGGGFTIGSVQTHAVLCKTMANLAQMVVISVEYRLAPQFTFPSAHNDARTACAWIHQNASDLKLSASHLFVGGDSAGGTLSLYCAQQSALEGTPFRGQILFYPGCSPSQDMHSHHSYSEGYLLEAQSIAYFYALYFAGQDASQAKLDWRFSALCSPHLNLMPPSWVGLAQCDPLRDEGVALANALAAKGRAVSLNIYNGVVHGFIKMGRILPEALEAQKGASLFLQSLL